MFKHWLEDYFCVHLFGKTLNGAEYNGHTIPKCCGDCSVKLVTFCWLQLSHLANRVCVSSLHRSLSLNDPVLVVATFGFGAWKPPDTQGNHRICSIRKPQKVWVQLEVTWQRWWRKWVTNRVTTDTSRSSTRAIESRTMDSVVWSAQQVDDGGSKKSTMECYNECIACTSALHHVVLDDARSIPRLVQV